MTLDQQLIQMASGEHRLDPDQQRRYLGTFAERLVLSAKLADATQPKLLEGLEPILSKTLASFPQLQLKLSAQLDAKTQMTYLKTAQKLGIAATIVDEDGAKSPYGFVLHAGQAVDVQETDVRARYPELFTASEAPDKKSFWQKIFG